MSIRHLTRNFCQLARQITRNQRFYSSISFVTQQQQQARRFHFPSLRTFSSSVQTNDNAYRDLETFLQKEIQLEKSAQKHPSNLPAVLDFQVQSNGPEVTLTRQTGNEKLIVKFNVTNTVNTTDSIDQPQDENNSSTQLKSRPTFTVDINRGGQTLSFLCSYLPNDYPDAREKSSEMGNEVQEQQEQLLEDFQIDEFAIHDGDWNETVYSSDCSVIDGELYDKLLNLLEEHGIGEEFANQLADFATAHEHRQYIGLLDKLQQFVKK